MMTPPQSLKSSLFGERITSLQTGKGSSQPQGVTVGGTAAFTAAGAAALTAAEIMNLFYDLPSGYNPTAWVGQRGTQGAIRALTGDNFQFVNTPQGGVAGELIGVQFLDSSSMPAMATGNKSLVIGDWSFYGLARRQGLTIMRNPYFYASSGQVSFHVSARFGGAVLQAEALQYATQA